MAIGEMHTTSSAPPRSPEARAAVATPMPAVAVALPGDDDHASALSARLARRRKLTLWERVEAAISRLSTRSNFWHRVCSLIWLPYAFHSGIKMKRLNRDVFVAVLPFRRFNRNWYNAMAGAALLGNAEIAGGMYVFGVCGADYTVVCKHLSYKFLRPCTGPAVYRIRPRQSIADLLKTGEEFNIALDMEVCQQTRKPRQRERRVGHCEIVFHVTPKAHHKDKQTRRENRQGQTPGESLG